MVVGKMVVGKMGVGKRKKILVLHCVNAKFLVFCSPTQSTSGASQLQSPDPVKITCPVCLDDDKTVGVPFYLSRVVRKPVFGVSDQV